MPYDPTRPNDVRPHNFGYEHVFYFDGETAMMIGHYKGDPAQSIGIRWMVAEGELGYPVTRGNPMWMVAPDKLALYMLEGIQANFVTEAANICDTTRFENALNYIRRKTAR